MELPSFEEAIAALDGADPGTLGRLFQATTAPEGPRNRHERRALEKRRRAKGRAPARQSTPAEDKAPESKPAAQAEPSREINDLPLFLLQQWSATRGPLFKNPCVAVARAIAMDCPLNMARGGGADAAAGIRAARYLGEHLKPVPDAKTPATGEEFARASALLADVRRAARGSSDPIGAIHSVIVRAALQCGGAGPEAQLALIGWAHLLAAVLCLEDDVVRLRAARTLLHWSAADAFKTGRGNPEHYDEDERELIAQAREGLGAPRASVMASSATTETTLDDHMPEAAAPT